MISEKITVSARTKEEEEEYRYHLEADIPWVNIDSNTKNQLQIQMPENISSKKERYVSKYNIVPQVADILAADKYFSELFEKANNETNAKDIANMITTDLMGLVNTREKREQSKLEPTHLADLIESIKLNKITRTSAKLALEEIVKTGNTLSQIINELDLGNVSDESTLSDIIVQILNDEIKAVENAKQNPEIVNFLVGKVMQKNTWKGRSRINISTIKKKILALTKIRILVLGGGFAGVDCTRKLERYFQSNHDIEITLVSDDNFLLFTPMLPQVASGTITPRHIVMPLRGLCKKARIYESAVRDIDPIQKHVTLEGTPEKRGVRIHYDYLVIALGSQTNFFGLRDVEKYSFTMKTLADALSLRNRIIDMFGASRK